MLFVIKNMIFTILEAFTFLSFSPPITIANSDQVLMKKTPKKVAIFFYRRLPPFEVSFSNSWGGLHLPQ